MVQSENIIIKTAAALRDLIDVKHAAAVSAQLGCTVVILRREDIGHGITVPVFGVPLEFLETAELLGLRAEGVQ